MTEPFEHICSKCARKLHLKTVPRYCVVCGQPMTRAAITDKETLEHKITVLRSRLAWRRQEVERLTDEITQAVNEFVELEE